MLKKYSLWGVVLLLLTVTTAMGQELDLDPYLLDHVIYAKTKITTRSVCKSPEDGLVGTPKDFVALSTFLVQTDIRTGTYTSQYEGTSFADNCIMFFETYTARPFAKTTTSDDTVRVEYAYTTVPDKNPQEPRFPNLGSVDFTYSGVTISQNGTYEPGQYEKIDLNAGRSITLKAGVYYFKSISTESSANITISPNDAGEYKTEIYVQDGFNLNSGAKLKVGDKAGYGQVAIYYQGSTPITFVSTSEVTATLIAPSAKVNFNSEAKLIGQVMADEVELIDFDGGTGIIFNKLVKSNIFITPPDFVYEDTIVKAGEDINNVDRSYTTPIICSLSTAVPAGAEASFKYQITKETIVKGIAEYGVDFKLQGLPTVLASGTTTIKAGENKKFIDSLYIKDDSDHEGSETFQIIFYDATSSSDKFKINFGADTLFHTITIIDDDPDNNAPTDISITNNNVKENEPIGTTVATFTTDDPDGETDFTYELVGSTGEFTISGNTLSTNKIFDYELEPRSYTVTIKSTDRGGKGLSITKQFTVSILPVNDNNAKGIARELYSATENIDLQVNAADGVLKNATDADEPQLENRLDAILKAQAKHGTVTLGTDGSFKYVQNPGLEVVIDSFSYTITDKTTYDNIVHTNEDKIYWAVINITPVDDNPPVAGTPAESVIYENEVVTIDVTSLISDGDGTPVTIAAGADAGLKAPTQGTIIVDPTGKITYTHDGTKESPFTDSFEYVAVSGGEQSAPALVSIRINPINDNVSVATPNSYSVEEKKSVSGNVKNDGIPDSDADEATADNILLAQLVDAPANHVGEFVLNPDGSFTYTNDGTPGTDQFTYKLTDDVTYSTNYPDKYKIVNTSNTVTVTINVSALNSSTPTARDTIANVDENSSFEIDIAKLIDDADLLKSGLSPAEKLTITVPAATAEGNASMKTADGTIIQYTHGQGDVTKEVFTDVITYTVTDGANHTATGNVNVTINPKNDNAPAAQDDNVNAYIGVAVTLYPLKDNGNGADDFDLDEERIHTTLRLDDADNGIVSGPTHGTLVRKDDYTYTYTVDPAHDLATEGTTDQFTYRIIDPITSGYVDPTVHTATATVYITIAAMPGDVPIPHDDELVVDEGGSASVLVGGATSVMANDEDSKNGAPKTHVTVVSATTEFGTVDLKADGTFTYTHDGSENFTDFFEYVLYTANSQSIINGRVNITVNPKNDNAPVITPDTIRINEGESATIGIITDKDTDVDEGTKLLAVTTAKQAASYGTVSILADGTVTYTHDGSESGNNDLFIVTITDSVGYDPTVKHEVDNPVVVIITAVNDNKPSGTDKEYRVDENGTLNISDSAKGILSDAVDLDGGTLTATILKSPDYAVPGTFKVNPNGTFVYEQNSAEKLVDQFTVTLSDGELDTTLTVTININPLNDELAFGTDETFETAEGATVDSTITLSGITDADRNDTIPDPFGNTYRIELVEGKDVKRGTLTLNPNGTFIYVNNGIGEYTTDSFTYVIIDSTTYHDSVHTSEEVTVTFTIRDENDEIPVAVTDTILVAEGETAVLLKNGEDNVTWNDTDGDANTVLTVSVPTGSEAKNGEITLDPAGTFTYVHDGSATVADSFYYVANDGVNNSAPVLVYVEITAKPPVVESAEYFDKNADGIVDEVIVTYNHDIDKDGSDFKLRWDVDSKDITITDTAYGAGNNIVILSLDGSKQYRTSGRMILTTVHNDGFGNVEVEQDVADKAAPVVSGVHYDAKVGTGTLAITLSEHMAGSYEKPFTLVKVEDKSEVILDFINAFTNSGTTYSVEVPFSEQTFVKNDSIYITITEKVADGSGNMQENPDNIRQPIRTSNGIVSAAYFDTSNPADGKIDKIAVKTALTISDTLLDSIIAKTALFTMNVDRQFEITGYELFDDSYGFNILVTEKSETVNTGVSKADFLKINMDIIHGSTTLPADSLPISDSVAPIILKGTFGITSSGETLDTTMILTYSEPVVSPTGSPYGFYDRSNDSKFDMTLTYIKSVTDVQKHFKASGITIDYVVSGDSVRIEEFGVGTVSDSAGNEQDSTTVYAPIVVTMDYGIDIELLIFPQPLVMDVDSDDRKHPRALHKDMVAMYNLDKNFSSVNGVAFIIEANGPLSISGNTGKAQLFDQIGNAVSEELTMFFEPKTSGNMAGVAIWDGKNIAGRVVGRNSYLLVVEVSVLTDEGSKSRVIEKQFIKTVGVTF